MKHIMEWIEKFQLITGSITAFYKALNDKMQFASLHRLQISFRFTVSYMKNLFMSIDINVFEARFSLSQ